MWTKLLSRQDVDIPTISIIDIMMYNIIWQSRSTKKEILFTHFYQDNFTHYINASKYHAGINQFNKYFNTPTKIKKYYNKGQKFIRRTQQQTKYWQSKIRHDKSRQTLLSAFHELRQNFLEMNRDYSVRPWWVIEAWEKDCEKNIRRLIKKNNLSDFEKQIFYSLYKPWKPTAINKIQAESKTGSKTKQLAAKYQFLRSWALIWYKSIDNNWIKNISSSAKNKQKTISQKKILKLLQPNKKEKQFITLSPYMTFFKDWRDDLRRKFSFDWSFLFDTIAKRYHLDRHDLGYLLLDEIEDTIKIGQLDKAKLVRRKKKPCIITMDLKTKKIKIFDEKIPPKYIHAIKQASKINSHSIQGQTAHKGIVKGKIQTIKNLNDIKKFQPGNILVANTTHPNYLSAIQKSSAIITNEGGIISHAAIVARELKKPCVIGTKYATKLLKDGDLVEVDANKGIVKRLKY